MLRKFQFIVFLSVVLLPAPLLAQWPQSEIALPLQPGRTTPMEYAGVAALERTFFASDHTPAAYFLLHTYLMNASYPVEIRAACLRVMRLWHARGIVPPAQDGVHVPYGGLEDLVLHGRLYDWWEDAVTRLQARPYSTEGVPVMTPEQRQGHFLMLTELIYAVDQLRRSDKADLQAELERLLTGAGDLLLLLMEEAPLQFRLAVLRLWHGIAYPATGSEWLANLFHASQLVPPVISDTAKRVLLSALDQMSWATEMSPPQRRELAFLAARMRGYLLGQSAGSSHYSARAILLDLHQQIHLPSQAQDDADRMRRRYEALERLQHMSYLDSVSHAPWLLEQIDILMADMERRHVTIRQRARNTIVELLLRWHSQGIFEQYVADWMQGERLQAFLRGPEGTPAPEAPELQKRQELEARLQAPTQQQELLGFMQAAGRHLGLALLMLGEAPLEEDLTQEQQFIAQGAALITQHIVLGLLQTAVLPDKARLRLAFYHAAGVNHHCVNILESGDATTALERVRQAAQQLYGDQVSWQLMRLSLTGLPVSSMREFDHNTRLALHSQSYKAFYWRLQELKAATNPIGTAFPVLRQMPLLPPRVMY